MRQHRFDSWIRTRRFHEMELRNVTRSHRSAFEEFYGLRHCSSPISEVGACEYFGSSIHLQLIKDHKRYLEKVRLVYGSVEIYMGQTSCKTNTEQRPNKVRNSVSLGHNNMISQLECQRIGCIEIQEIQRFTIKYLASAT